MKNLFKPPRRPLHAFMGLLGIAVSIVVLGPDLVFAQCAMCRDAVASSSAETREALSYAIIGLALTPYAIAAVAAWAISPAVRAFVRSRLSRLGIGRMGGPW